MLMYIYYYLSFYVNKAKTIGMIVAIVAVAAFAAMTISPTPIAHAQWIVTTPTPNTNTQTCAGCQGSNNNVQEGGGAFSGNGA